MKEFNKAHDPWIRSHLERRHGERRGRLERGHGHGERLFLQNVWWPLNRHLDDLHPEYEVPDWRGRSYFADFAYIPKPGHLKFLLEVKGFGPHVRDTDRIRYCGELNRELFMQAMGFRIFSFAYDDVEQRPETCIALLRMLLSRYQPSAPPVEDTAIVEKEVLRLALMLARPIRPKDVENHFVVNHRTAVRYVQSLCDKGWLQPIVRGKGSKVLQYELVPGCWEYFG